MSRSDAEGRGSVLALLLATVAACSSGSGEGPGSQVEGGTGGEVADPSASEVPAPAADRGGGEGSASVSEGPPASLPNVMPPGSDRAPAQPSPGCGRLEPVATGERTLDVEGVLRTFLLDLPTGYEGTQPFPLVFAFHGATTSAAFFRSARYGNLLSTMGGGAILVHPDALGDPTAWDERVDLPFFDALLSTLDDTLCVDQARVFATGHSSGGFFTNALGCQRGDVLRAIAPVSAGGPFAPRGSGCRGDVAVWLAHADNDPTVAFDNGVRSRDRWLDANACADTTSASEPPPCVEYADCAVGRPVRWCVYADGHAWPDFAPQGIWGFFSSL